MQLQVFNEFTARIQCLFNRVNNTGEYFRSVHKLYITNIPALKIQTRIMLNLTIVFPDKRTGAKCNLSSFSHSFVHQRSTQWTLHNSSGIRSFVTYNYNNKKRIQTSNGMFVFNAICSKKVSVRNSSTVLCCLRYARYDAIICYNECILPNKTL